MINRKMQELGAKRSVIRELFEYGKIKKGELGEEAVFDFSLGNPSVPAPEIVNDRWLFWRSKQRYFNVGQIAICLLRLSYDTWLLTTIKEVERELNVTNGINYEGREIEKYR